MLKSLSIFLSLIIPQWPELVYWHKQTSAIITILSSKLLFISEIAFCTIPCSTNADVPFSSFCEGIPNNITAGIFKSEIFCTSFETSDKGSLAMSGIESTCFFFSNPSSTKIGQTKSFVDNLTSWTKFLMFSLILNRLNLFEGNVAMIKT